MISCAKNLDEDSYTANEMATQKNYEPNSQSSFNEDSVIIGIKLQNPYSIETMVQAYENVKDAGLLKNNYTLIPDHYYIRILPTSDEDFEILKNEYNLELFDYPLDHEIIGDGEFSYHDPLISSNNYTWQYTVIDIDDNLPAVQFEILDTVFLNEDRDYNYTIVQDNEDWSNIEREAFRITNNLDSDDVNIGVAAFGCNSWKPNGRIRVYDDIAGGLIPVEGALVKARRFVKIRRTFTDSNGEFETKSFCGEVNYSIQWEQYHYTIRDGWLPQAYYNGPKQKGSWNLDIVNGESKSLRYATMHRAAYRYFYKNIDGLKRPNVWSQLKLVYKHSVGTGVNWGNWDFTGIFPDIKIWGKRTNAIWWDTNELFSTTIHEIGHASHIELMNFGEIQFGQVQVQIRESWANAIEWHITKVEYNELGFPNYDNPNLATSGDHMQWWTDEDSHDYTSLFIDLVDDYNQSIERDPPSTNRCPNGGVFDGIGCLVGSPPSGTDAFLWENAFYYTPIGCCDCPMSGSWYDGANCYVSHTPENTLGFINSNSWYLFPAGNPTRPYDQVEDYTMDYLESNVMKHTYGLSGLRDNLKENKPWGVTDRQIDIYLDYFFNL